MWKGFYYSKIKTWIGRYYVILNARKLIGATKPLEAEPGTIRGDLAIDIGRNIIHGSDGEDTAKFEIDLWFNEKELCKWETSDSKWRLEK